MITSFAVRLALNACNHNTEKHKIQSAVQAIDDSFLDDILFWVHQSAKQPELERLRKVVTVETKT
jgi:hypothetical protein